MMSVKKYVSVVPVLVVKLKHVFHMMEQLVSVKNVKEIVILTLIAVTDVSVIMEHVNLILVV
jgi:hypothetical protein